LSIVNYKPYPVSERFLLSNAFIRGIMGPYGSGKSVACVMALLQWAMQQEPADDGIRYTRFVIVRNTNRMLEDTTIQTVHEWVPPTTPASPGAGTWLATKKNFTLRFGDVHSEWWFRALDDEESARNLLSLEITGAWINEYREINPRILTDLIGRVGRYRGPGKVKPTAPGIIMDSNPPSVDGFWHDFFEKEPSEEMAALAEKIEQDTGRPLRELFKQPSGLSPDAENIDHLPPNYYELMLANNADLGPEWAKIHVHGEYGYSLDGVPVYSGFSHDFHVSNVPLTPVPGQRLALGMDFGRTPAVVVGQQNARGQWMILGELTTEKKNAMGLERFMERLIPWLRQRWPDHDEYELWADPAGSHRPESNEKSCYDVLRAHGFTPRKGPQDLETRIGSVQRVLSRQMDGKPGIIYDPSCKELIKGKLGTYKFREIRNEAGELSQTPVKNDSSHVADAEQYLIGGYEGPAMRGRGERPWKRGGGHRKPIVVRSNWKVL